MKVSIWVLVALAAICASAFLLAYAGRLRSDLRRMRQRQAGDLVRGRELERAQTIADERARIFADLHDDVGAKLLTLIHSLDDRQHADLARSVLQDFRDIVSRSRDSSGSLQQVLGQIRDETEQRLEIARVALHWEMAGDLPDPALDQAQALHLFRIVREAVSNALRHASPTRIRIRARQVLDELVLDITDDGPAAGPVAESGQGVVGMKSRAAELHGQIDWSAGTEGGTKVMLRFPLPAHAAGDSEPA